MKIAWSENLRIEKEEEGFGRIEGFRLDPSLGLSLAVSFAQP